MTDVKTGLRIDNLSVVQHCARLVISSQSRRHIWMQSLTSILVNAGRMLQSESIGLVFVAEASMRLACASVIQTYKPLTSERDASEQFYVGLWKNRWFADRRGFSRMPREAAEQT
jgi:hypothetical protein